MEDEPTRIRTRPPTQSAAPTAEADTSISIPGVLLGANVGVGGMAMVFEGQDLGFNPPRRVAIKLMDPTLSADPDFRARFEREASIVAEFRHDNIVHIYASGESRGTKYIVMEFLPGGTLAHHLDQGPMELRQALHTGARMAAALAYSHERNVIHRDFKPGNILLTADGKPVLSDFGVAKSSSPLHANLTRHAEVIGAPRYMAPEQERGEEVTDRADVFSLGLTLYEMLAGVLPPARLRTEPSAQELSERLPDTPPRVIDLLERALRLNPDTRPTAREFAHVLEEASARAADPAARSVRWLRVNTRYFAITATVTLVLATLGYFVAANLFRAKDANPPGKSSADLAAIAVNLVRSPQFTHVVIDGTDAAAASLKLTPARHHLMAVAPGYYGINRTFDVGRTQSPLVEVRLDPVRAISGNDFDRFLDLADEISGNATGDSLDSLLARVGSMQDPTLQSALRLKLLRSHGRTTEADALQEETAALAHLGDTRAASAVALMGAVMTGEFTVRMATPELQAAADKGDALASFLLALSLRDQLREAPGGITPNNPIYEQYCSRLQTAIAQGWSGLPKMFRSDCASVHSN